MRAIRICGFFALLGLMSCDIFHQDDPGCPPIAGLYFDVQNVSISPKRLSDCCAMDVKVFERMPFKKFLLQIDYEASYYSMHAAPTHFSLIPSSYAMSCASNGQNGSKERILEIDIITLFDIDSQHKKGQSVSDLFDIEEFGSRLNLNAYLSNEDHRLRAEQMNLYLNNRPNTNDTCAFKIKMILDNGESYTSITTPVIFN